MMEQGVEKLKVYRLAHQLGVKVHDMSLTLPKHEMYEEGSQIRRSSKSVSSNIVEGFSLRNYKMLFAFTHSVSRMHKSGLRARESATEHSRD